LFASAVSAQALRLAVEAGADVAELGNFDDMYARGEFISAAEVMTLAEESLLALAGKAPLCVTIPGHLNRQTQLEMLHALADMGVAMVQTEGAIRLLNDEKVQLLSVEEKAAMSLENARFLAEANVLPVMVASGISSNNTLQALQTGALAVGIGSSFNKLDSEEAMLVELQACQVAVQNVLQAIA
jgi:tryptophan synthase alpha subunit